MKGLSLLLVAMGILAPTASAQDVQSGLMKAVDYNAERAAFSRIGEPKSLSPAELKDLQKTFGDTLAQANPGKESKASLIDGLANHDVDMRVFTRNQDGSVSYLTGKATLKNQRTIIQRDYMAYRWETIGGKDRRVGILLRIEAEMTATGGNLDLGSLLAFGLAAKQNDTNGVLRVRVYGLSGEPISVNIPAPSDLSDASIQAAMEAVAVIKSAMYDDRVSVIPQVLPDSI
jgi:hypothetical protein